MALQLSISTCIKDNCSTLVFRDTTGTAWDDSGLDIADYHYARIDILLPDGITTKTFEFDNIGIFPTTDTTFEYEIPCTSLYGSSTSSITDGLYLITYTVQEDKDTGNLIKTQKYFLYSCNVSCCVNKLFAKIATIKDCGCDNYYIKNALYASALLKSLDANRGCGNKTLINKLLSELNKICGSSNENCGCK